MSFSIHHDTAEPMALKRAILLYGPKHGSLGYATVHDVVPGPNNTPVIKAGKALDRAVLSGIVTDLAGASRRRHGLLPPNVLAVGDASVMWWLPPGIRTFYFDTATTDANSIGKRAGKAWHPGLIFVAGRNEMWAFAVKGEKRPESGTPLYHAPLMNVWDGGKVCTGTMPIPDTALASAIGKWEDSFFGSAFTHPNHPMAVKYKGGLHAFWRDMLDGKHARFPESVLVPIKDFTVGMLADGVEARQ